MTWRPALMKEIKRQSMTVLCIYGGDADIAGNVRKFCTNDINCGQTE